MKPRKIIVTLEILTDIPLSKFKKSSLDSLFNDCFETGYDEIQVQQVTKQAVKEDK